MAKNEVTTTEQKQELTVEHKPALQVDIDQSDMMVPFLKVIQSLSEEVMQGKDKYNPDVRPGDIYDSVTRTIFRDARVVICGLKKYFAEWTPEVRGTLVAKHKPDSFTVKSASKVGRTTDKGSEFFMLKTATGNDLVETYGIVMIVKNSDGLILPAVITLSKTSFVVGKQLSTILAVYQNKGVPIFRMHTTATSNTKGSWYKPAFTFEEYETDPDVIAMAQGMSTITDKILFNNEDQDHSTDHIPSLEEELIQ